MMDHPTGDKTKLIARVRRIGGQVASLERALEAGTDCAATLHQVATIRGATQGLMLQLLEGHLREHLVSAKGPRVEAELAPMLAVLRSYLK